MHPRNWIVISSAVVLVMLCGTSHQVGAQQLRYFERNGITYREVLGSPAVAQIPQSVACPPLVYRPQFYFETHQVLRSYWVPVTEYRWETRWVNWWNPFAEPYQELRYVPVIRWEYRTEIAEMPVTCQRWVAEPATGATSYAATGTPGVSVVPVAGLPNSALTYAPRLAANGQSTPSKAPVTTSRPLEPAAAFSTSGDRVPESSPAVACRWPLRPPPESTSVGMVPVQVPGWSGRPEIGGIRRYEDGPPRFGW